MEAAAEQQSQQQQQQQWPEELVLLEVNARPSLAFTSQLDREVKLGVLLTAVRAAGRVWEGAAAGVPSTPLAPVARRHVV